MRICLLISGLLCGFFVGVAQKQVSVFGIVVDEQNMPVSDVFVSVNWSKKGLLSKADGSFYITANSQDTLVFKHLSFEPKAVALSGSSADTLKVQLTERTLVLDEVQITNWGDWKDFKHKIAEMDTDSIRNTDAYRLEMMFGAKKRHPVKNPYFRGQIEPKINPLTIIGGIFSGKLPQMLYDKYSGVEKRRRKVEKEKMQELCVQKNAYRYSEELLAKTLKIEGEELKAFKIHCDYTLDFSKKDYQFIEQILKLYKEWKALPQLEVDSVKLDVFIK